MKLNFRAIISWCLYDFGITAFNVIVVTFVFAAYFTAKIAPNSIIGTHLWGNAIAISGLLVAIVSPLAGSIADFGGHRKTWLFILTYMGIGAVAILWFAYPGFNSIWLTLIALVIGLAAFEICAVFYNSLLKSIASNEYLGRISGWAWASGYLGGLVSLAVALVVFVNGNWLGLDAQNDEHIRVTALFAAAWIFLFTLPLFFFVRDLSSFNLSAKESIKQGSHELFKTLFSLHQYPIIFRYLLARMIYTDGLNTLFAFGGIYAVGTFHFTMQQVLLFGIIMNIAAGLGAFLFSWLDDYMGSKKTILFALSALTILLAALVMVQSVSWFWLFATLACFFIGPTQASSRSFLIRLAPPERLSEMFGLYAFSGRATAFIGPFLVGELTLILNSQRLGLSVILLFFLGGAFLLYFVNPEEEHPIKINYAK